MTPIDLRSDTVTRPTPGMRDAIARAAVGDDVFGDDPTVRALELRVAGLLGMEAALYVPSGTMGNQLALAAQSRPGDQVIVEEQAHIVRYEVGGSAALSGLQLTPVRGEAGALRWADIDAALYPDDIHCAPPALVCHEDTHNRAGGAVLPLAELDTVAAMARARGLRVHLDGARLWNASVASGVDLARIARTADTVSVCFSKGLGAPVGSALAGSSEVIARARRLRKRWGGGMRQVGILAAACDYALDHHVERLAIDHENARLLAQSFTHPALRCAVPPQTNIVLLDVDGAVGAERFARALQQAGVLVSVSGPTRLRLVTHLDVDAKACEQAAAVARGLRP